MISSQQAKKATGQFFFLPHTELKSTLIKKRPETTWKHGPGHLFNDVFGVWSQKQKLKQNKEIGQDQANKLSKMADWKGKSLQTMDPKWDKRQKTGQ